MKHRKPRKVEDKKVNQELWCVGVERTYQEDSLPAKCKCCANNLPFFTLAVPDKQEMNIAYSLDDLFSFKPGKRYKLAIEEIPWDDSGPQMSK